MTKCKIIKCLKRQEETSKSLKHTCKKSMKFDDLKAL
jgi:hypothetical protein